MRHTHLGTSQGVAGNYSHNTSCLFRAIALKKRIPIRHAFRNSCNGAWFEPSFGEHEDIDIMSQQITCNKETLRFERTDIKKLTINLIELKTKGQRRIVADTFCFVVAPTAIHCRLDPSKRLWFWRRRAQQCLKYLLAASLSSFYQVRLHSAQRSASAPWTRTTKAE